MSLIYLVILAEGELNDGHSYIECGRELSLLHGTPLEWGDDEALYKKKEKKSLRFLKRNLLMQKTNWEDMKYTKHLFLQVIEIAKYIQNEAVEIFILVSVIITSFM